MATYDDWKLATPPYLEDPPEEEPEEELPDYCPECTSTDIEFDDFENCWICNECEHSWELS